MTATKPIDDRIRVYDTGPGTWCDRYTVVYLETKFVDARHGRGYQFIGMNSEPFHPQGFGQHGEVFRLGKHLGKRIKFADLPGKCQRLVLSDLRIIDSE